MDDVLSVMPSGFGRRPNSAITRRGMLLAAAALAAAGCGLALDRYFSVQPDPLIYSTFTYRLHPDRLPKPGAEPLYLSQAHVFLVNLRPGEGGSVAANV